MLTDLSEYITVGTLNTRGLLNCVEEIQKIRMKESKMTMDLSESWLRPAKSMPLNWWNESFCLVPAAKGRGREGVSLLHNITMNCSLVAKQAAELCKFVAMDSGGITIFGVYIIPRESKEELVGMLNKLKVKCTGIFFSRSD